MFQYDMSDYRDFETKRDLRSSYETFLPTIHQDLMQFPFEVENPTFWKGKPNHFRIVSWGGYMAQDGWRVFITYRASRLNHVKQHTWRWDSETDSPVDYKLNEFIG